jgi:DNA-binding response OmpR family regulator
MPRRETIRNMSRILLLEDDLSLISGLSFALQKQGFELEVARTISEAEKIWANGKFDLLVLDVTLPDGSGFDFCRDVRRSSKVPIIFLTASDEETNIIMGLDIGGDDYITKPFKLGVLISRINSLLRRANNFGISDMELESNGIKVLLTKGQAYKNGNLIDLTAGEYKLLCLFMQNPNIVLTKEQILDKLWDCDSNFIDDNTLTVYIRRLRIKIEDNPSEPKMIITVRRMGYQWRVV